MWFIFSEVRGTPQWLLRLILLILSINCFRCNEETGSGPIIGLENFLVPECKVSGQLLSRELQPSLGCGYFLMSFSHIGGVYSFVHLETKAIPLK